MIYLFSDGEFSGLDPIRSDPLDFYFIVTDERLNILDERNIQACPESFDYPVWSKEAERVHGISKYEAIKFQKRKQFCEELLSFLDPYEDIRLVIHALPESFWDLKRNEYSYGNIDYHVLEWAFRKEGMVFDFFKKIRHKNIINTLRIAREKTGNFRGHGLDEWAKRIGFKLNHHNCKSDTYCTFELYKHLCGTQHENIKKKGSLL